MLAEERQASREEGRAEGEAKFTELAAFLLRESRTDELTRAVTDLDYREKLYR